MGVRWTAVLMEVLYNFFFVIIRILAETVQDRFSKKITTNLVINIHLHFLKLTASSPPKNSG